jgi:hypothetical protein
MHDSLEDLDQAAAAPAPPSVLRELNAVQGRLADCAPCAGGHDGPAMRAIARELLHAVSLSADVALACVLRNQVAGSYAMRRSIETAVIASLVGRRLHVRPANLLSLVSAALALHASGRFERDAPAGRRNDGAGFFCGLLLDHSGDPVPDEPDVQAGAELLRMADRYCAGISARNYRSSLAPDDTLRRVLAEAPDPALAEAFAQELGPFPPGTVVRLAGGETGVVAHRDDGQPEVFCLLDDAGRLFATPQPRRVGEGCAIERCLGEEESDVRVSMRQIWGPLASL